MSGENETTVEGPILSERDTSAIAWAAVMAFVAGAALVGAFWLGTSGYSLIPVSSEALERSAHFGDAFGVINTMVSAAACVALIITLRMQARQMKDQEEDQRKAEEDRRRTADTMLLTAYLQLLESERGASNISESDDVVSQVQNAQRRAFVMHRMRCVHTALTTRMKDVLQFPDHDFDSMSEKVSDIVITLNEISSLIDRKIIENPSKDGKTYIRATRWKSEELFKEWLAKVVENSEPTEVLHEAVLRLRTLHQGDSGKTDDAFHTEIKASLEGFRKFALALSTLY